MKRTDLIGFVWFLGTLIVIVFLPPILATLLVE